MEGLRIAHGVPIACALSESGKARRAEEVGEALLAHAELVRELDDGYAWRLPAGGDWFERAAAFVAAERRCCPFFTFELGIEPELGPTWLAMRGGEGVKTFIEAAFLP